VRVLIIGATSTIATECERIWANDPGTHLILVGRNVEHLEALKNDLAIRYPQSTYEARVCEFESPESISTLIESVGIVDVALIAHGQLTDQVAAQSDVSTLNESLVINAVSPALFAESLIQHFEVQGYGTLAVIGSVAGDRARRSNYAYGSAKGFLELFVEGMQHRLVDSPINVVLIKPGPTTSKMTLAMPNPPKGMAEPQDVATDIVKAIAKGKSGVVYTPRKWQLIMLVIRNLPKFLFNKMNI